MDMGNYLDELNDGQLAAVLYNDGPSLVIAGAGSGKTRVLTYKIAYLLEQGYEPWSVLALTFTNKAAREMKERIRRQVGDSARYLWMGTFHSIFSRILRVEAAVFGFTSNFTIYDSSDSKSLLKSIIKEMQLDDKTYKAGTIQNRISSAKNRLILPDAYAADRGICQGDMEAKVPATHEIYRRYWDRCRQSNVMDFDDLLVYTYLLFDSYPEICEKYARQFKYVLVDEYQDTNYAQHCIVQQLTRIHQKVCVVGDDAQSIYSFRGANIDNILKFTQLYKGARLFKLEQNYRSTQTIVCAANSLIEKNREQIRKEVFSEKQQGEPVTVFNAYSDVEEGDIVVNQIWGLHRREGNGFNDFAILYRTNAQSMFVGFVKGMPLAIEEAAAIDGCGPLRTFFQVVFPMLKPIFISVGVLEIMWVWNDYLLPYLVLDRTEFRTIPIHIQYLQGSYGHVDLGATMALIMMAIVPIIIFYLTCQKYIVSGVMAGAVKG